jgi:hypothetical protein
MAFCQPKTYDIVGDNLVFANRNRIIHQINISENGTFEFRSIPHVSCLTWSEFEGIWTQKKNTITFTDSFELQAPDMEFDYSTSENDFYEFTFNLDEQKTYSNKVIEISYVYDYDSELKDVDSTYSTDTNGKVKIEFNKVKNREKLTAFKISTKIQNGEKRQNYFTLNDFVNEKKYNLPNRIYVNVVSSPFKETIVRTTTARITDEKMSIISSICSKSKLQNFISELNFGKEYERKFY